MKNMPPRLFISGIPTSGKSYLAKRLAKETGGIAVLFDDLRESLATDERYKKYTNFYLDLDEKEYLTKAGADEQWKNLVAQSEGLWPAFIKEINKYSNESRPVIFECVNILPHLAKKDLDFPGVVLIGESYEEILKRNKEDPRWGNSTELQELEAKTFFEIERPRYKSEAEKFGYPVFKNSDDAYEMALRLLKGGC
jgi:adenylate kinase